MEIFQECCRQYGLSCDQKAVEYLLTKHYDGGQHPMAACHPRDLLEEILDQARFHQVKPTLNREMLDWAVKKYFLE